MNDINIININYFGGGQPNPELPNKKPTIEPMNANDYLVNLVMSYFMDSISQSSVSANSPQYFGTATQPNYFGKPTKSNYFPTNYVMDKKEKQSETYNLLGNNGQDSTYKK